MIPNLEECANVEIIKGDIKISIKFQRFRLLFIFILTISKEYFEIEKKIFYIFYICGIWKLDLCYISFRFHGDDIQSWKEFFTMVKRYLLRINATNTCANCRRVEKRVLFLWIENHFLGFSFFFVFLLKNFPFQKLISCTMHRNEKFDFKFLFWGLRIWW